MSFLERMFSPQLLLSICIVLAVFTANGTFDSVDLEESPLLSVELSKSEIGKKLSTDGFTEFYVEPSSSGPKRFELCVNPGWFQCDFVLTVMGSLPSQRIQGVFEDDAWTVSVVKNTPKEVVEKVRLSLFDTLEILEASMF